jgi:hypothetical protein
MFWFVIPGLAPGIPAGSGGRGDPRIKFGRDSETGDEAVVLYSFLFSIENLDGEPDNQDRILRRAQRHPRQPTVDGGSALAAFANGLGLLLQFGAMPGIRRSSYAKVAFRTWVIPRSG